MKNLTISLDDDIYRNARRRAAEDGRPLSSVVREAIQNYGVQESGLDRQRRERHELLARWRSEGTGLDPSENLPREELYDRARVRRANPDPCR